MIITHYACSVVPKTKLAEKQQQVKEAKPDLIKSTDKQTAKVSLDDCLACSGCVTSAETVLITQQSTTKLLEAVSSKRYVRAK